MWGQTLALFPQGKSGFTLHVRVHGGGSTWDKEGASMVMARRAGNLAQTEARSGDGAQQSPEACLVSAEVYNQPYYITFCHMYKIAKNLHMDSFKMLIFKEMGRGE